MSPTPGDHDFGPTATWPMLRLRAELLARLRRFFEERDFLEVETPLLSADVVIEEHIEPFQTTWTPGRTLWLQASPEAAMKRLLCAGAGAIYQVTRSFRSGERGRLHNPEFTLVEWYRRGDSMDQGMRLLADLAETLLPGKSVGRISYAEAFQKYAQFDPHTATLAELASAARRGEDSPAREIDSDDRDDWLNLLLVDRVEPHLGRDGPVIVYDYPASQASLAQVRPGPTPVAERFELYADGVELANGFHELTDPAELRKRLRLANRRRKAGGKPPLPEESRLLSAMDQGLPDSTGAALGFDRLVMVAAGAKSIDEVLTFPIERA